MPYPSYLTDQSHRFIESESDLDTSLKQFLPLTQNPAQNYPELVRSGSISLLTSLLSHENTDIAVDVIEIIQELTDEDVGAEVDDIENEERDEGKMGEVRVAMGDLIDELVSTSRHFLFFSFFRLEDVKSRQENGGSEKPHSTPNPREVMF